VGSKKKKERNKTILFRHKKFKYSFSRKLQNSLQYILCDAQSYYLNSFI